MAATANTIEQPVLVSFTEQEWAQARELMLRTRRAQGLSEQVEDPVLLHQAGVLLRRRG